MNESAVATAVQEGLTPEITGLRRLLKRNTFGGPRAVALLDLVVELSEQSTLTPLYPAAVGKWEGIEKKDVNGVRGKHVISETGEEVELELIIPDLTPSDYNYARARYNPTLFKATSGFHQLDVSVKTGSIVKKDVEHIVEIAETDDNGSNHDDTGAEKNAFFQLLRKRLYSEEVEKIVETKAGVTGQIVLDTFRNHCPRPVVRFTEEPKTEMREVQIGLNDWTDREYYIPNTSAITSFSMNDDVSLTDGVHVGVSFGTKNYSEPGSVGYIGHIQGLKLVAKYEVSDGDNENNSQTIAMMISSSRGMVDDALGSAILTKSVYGHNDMNSGKFIGAPIPQSVNTFLDELSGEIEKERMTRFANQGGQESISSTIQ